MKIYKQVSQEDNGDLIGLYDVKDRTGDVQTDYDVLNDYTVYPHDNGSFIAEHKPTNCAYGAFKTLGEALDFLRDKINKQTELNEKIKKEAKKFDRIAKRNSLNERYKDKVVESKFEKWNRQAKQLADAGMKTCARINADYVERLISH